MVKLRFTRCPPSAGWRSTIRWILKSRECLLRQQASAHRVEKLPTPKYSALVFDFDGVFTDSKVIVFQDGQEAVVCDRSDGWAIGQIKKTGLPLLILSTETNPVVQARADKLGIPCLHGVQNKGEALRQWAAARNIPLGNVVYVGNDVNDLECMDMAGCAVAVADANPVAIQHADLVLEHPGGDEAVREICELITQRRTVTREQ